MLPAASPQSCSTRLQVLQTSRTRTSHFQCSSDWVKGGAWVHCDESVQATVTSTVEPLPILYVDDYTVLEEVFSAIFWLFFPPGFRAVLKRVYNRCPSLRI
eukprot:scaffold1247_cov251-Pinguiococcus_pyrenoidosus.AAC.14